MPAARRRRYRRRLRRYKNIWSEYNVLRTKCEYTTPLVFPQNNGQPIMTNSANNARRYMTFSEMMGYYVRNNNLREMFGYCKVTGVRLEAIPHCNNLSVAGINNQTPVCLAVIFGSSGENAGADYNDIVAINSSIVLDGTNRQVKYWSAKGGSWDLKVAADVNAIGAGSIIVRSMADGAFQTSPGWNIKITLYCYWRYAKTI